jgi:hypothetical protein
VFFRAENLTSAIKLLGSMAGWHGFSFETAGLSFKLASGTKRVLVFLAVVWLFPNSHEILAEHKPALEYTKEPVQVSLAPTPRWLGERLTWRPTLPWALVLTALMVWSVLSLSQPSEFIYWQF